LGLILRYGIKNNKNILLILKIKINSKMLKEDLELLPELQLKISFYLLQELNKLVV